MILCTQAHRRSHRQHLNDNQSTSYLKALPIENKRDAIGGVNPLSFPFLSCHDVLVDVFVIKSMRAQPCSKIEMGGIGRIEISFLDVPEIVSFSLVFISHRHAVPSISVFDSGICRHRNRSRFVLG